MAATESSKKRWLAWTAIAMLLIVAGVGGWIWSSLGYITTDDARVKADIVTISTEVPGRIGALHKDEGDAVKPGEVMVELDTRGIRIRIEQHKAAVDYARGQLVQAERELSHAGDAQQRQIREAAMLARKARVREAEAALQELGFRLGLMTLRSPVQGLVVKKNAHRGEFVQPGQPVFMVVDSSRYWVEANVDETQIRFVKPGSTATVRLDSYPGVQFDGEVTDVGGATTSEFSLFSPQKLTGVFIKSTQKLPVKIAVKDTDGTLRVGMLAVVRIEKPEGRQEGLHAGGTGQ
ncbi:MAG: HlyD family secretion protein [Deltaproteobacteria bacterium]|nr:HlyD family secretion protein [Deltaproteobacteria bacterium]